MNFTKEGLDAGIGYIYTVRDANGCTGMTSFTINGASCMFLLFFFWNGIRELMEKPMKRSKRKEEKERKEEKRKNGRK